MEKTVEVHLKTIVWKAVTIEVPEDEDPKEFIDDIMEHDPACSDYAAEEEASLRETEEVVEGEYYIPTEDDDLIYHGSRKLPANVLHNLRVLIDHSVDNPMRAVHELHQQAQKDGYVLADEIVTMKKGIRYKLTVNNLLEILQT